MEKHGIDQGEFVPLGGQTEVTPQRQAAAETEFDIRYQSALTYHNHLWIVTICHYASDQMLAGFFGESKPGELPILDHESIAVRPAIGCFICEESYTKDLAWRKCKGEPRG